MERVSKKNQILCKRIALWRKKNGMEQKVFAKKLGLSQSFISQVENGWNVPSMDNLYAMADILGIDVVSFFQPVRYEETI